MGAEYYNSDVNKDTKAYEMREGFANASIHTTSALIPMWRNIVPTES